MQKTLSRSNRWIRTRAGEWRTFPVFSPGDCERLQHEQPVGVARAAYIPDLTLTGTGGYESSEFSTLFRVPNRFWSLGPNLAQTVFDAGAIHAQVKQNIALYDFNVATYRETVLTAFQDVEDNLATLKLLAQESQAEINAAKAAELTLEITQNWPPTCALTPRPSAHLPTRELREIF